jgi:16S rRNA G966 N2-methylase RsmD
VKNAFRRTTSGRRSGQRFDAEHSVVTEALLFLGELDPEAIGAAIEDATHYEPTPVAECKALINALPAPLERFTFVDIGAGMGRVVMLAALRPFRQVVGVEVSAALCETARDNLVRRRASQPALACSDIRIVCKDAAQYHFPTGDLAVYLYNPFGEQTLARLVESLTKHASGDVYVLYHTPVHRELFDVDARFELVADLNFGLVYALPNMPRSFCA